MKMKKEILLLCHVTLSEGTMLTYIVKSIET